MNAVPEPSLTPSLVSRLDADTDRRPHGIAALDYTPQVEALLHEAGLPTGDLGAGAAVRFIGVHAGRTLAGVVGIEGLGRVGLLRSLAVARSHRGQGLGAALVRRAEQLAAVQGIDTLYLLTTGAADFFLAQGYRKVDRSTAPADIASTTQFRGLCPSSSTCMVKALATDPSRRRAGQQAR